VYDTKTKKPTRNKTAAVAMTHDSAQPMAYVVVKQRPASARKRKIIMKHLINTLLEFFDARSPTDGVEEHVFGVAAGLPHGEPTQAG